MRIDIYLKLMGIFRTRSVAARACKGGYISVSNSAIKPSYSVNMGDRLEIVKPDASRIMLEVLKIPTGKQVSRKDRQDYFRIVGMGG